MHDCKAPKIDRSISEGAQNKGKVVVSCESNASSTDLQEKLKEQRGTLWKLKDELKKHVSTAELRNMLDANGQDTSGPERHLLDSCADGMLFGALGHCPVCSSFLYYHGGQYHYNGYVSEWSKCTYPTTDPVRSKKKWKIPDEMDNDYLAKWFKPQKVKKPERVLPPMSPEKSLSQSTVGDGLDKLRVSIVAQSKDVVVSNLSVLFGTVILRFSCEFFIFTVWLSDMKPKSSIHSMSLIQSPTWEWRMRCVKDDSNSGGEDDDDISNVNIVMPNPQTQPMYKDQSRVLVLANLIIK
ncbi:poly [ADP-ribose] polymerase 1-like [Oryza brachyantha]|uniref:poly [ADP-ribose] polymerase 1-like n=1 Tax=Oryza brachyantha TaxID=4533 RepID=UPI001ADB5BD9|nr:poly [ADP-ribose] polymerase 1-like [Oryza brachyantha]